MKSWFGATQGVLRRPGSEILGLHGKSFYCGRLRVFSGRLKLNGKGSLYRMGQGSFGDTRPYPEIGRS